jgi:D-alanyl-D-alanine carboxypeptidase (penicillin-binding protein 5/6)
MKTNHRKTRTRRSSVGRRPNAHIATGIAVFGLVSFGVFGVTYAMMLPLLQTQPATQSVAVLNTATTTPSGPNAYAQISLIGKSAIVYDLTTGQTLYAQNSNAELPLASITKLLTLYAAANVLQPTSPVTMTPDSVAETNDAADAGFKKGETFSFEDLARLTLAASSNNGAQAIADAATAAQTSNTTSLLAGAAASIGLTQTHATNGTGLDINSEVAGGYGSAHDIAVLAGALLKQDPLIAQATTLPSISITSQQGDTHTFANTDIDVTHLPDPLLSKTGYTDLAGGNLVVVYDAAINHPVAIVVLGSTESGRFTDVQQLVSATLAHFAGTLPAAPVPTSNFINASSTSV